MLRAGITTLQPVFGPGRPAFHNHRQFMILQATFKPSSEISARASTLLFPQTAAPAEQTMAVVITEIATPRKVRIALLTLLLFAAMC
jgi:hypothetical protein